MKEKDGMLYKEDYMLSENGNIQAGDKSGKLPSRAEIAAEYMWRLEDIYESYEKWEEDFSKVRQLLGEFPAFAGTLGSSGVQLLKCLEFCNRLFSLNDKVFIYARMKRDEDNANPVCQAIADRAVSLGTELYAAASFIIPELISIDEGVLRNFLHDTPGLGLYTHYVDEILRQKQHVLPKEQEELLALASEILHAPSDIFGMFNNADIKFPVIRDEEGNEVELTKGRYIKFLESKDRRVRLDAFKALYSRYEAMRNTLASALSSNIKKNKYFAIVRKYGSSLGAAMESDNINADVYDNLIDTVDRHLPLLHRYLRLRKRALKLDELHMYDLYVPIVNEPKKNIPYKEALRLVAAGLQTMGEEYSAHLEKAFESGWIDVYENEGKTSGAYSWGAYLTHPYVLLNYQGTIDDVFTIAHEMGHALHTYYTNTAQPYIYSEYRIFVAEVASTVNETLLVDYMLKNTSNKEEKAFLLNHQLEEFRGTLFRQVMFAEFEKMAHTCAENGEALTADKLCSIYRGLNDKYFSAEVVVDNEINAEWSRIPHFYRSFYVYKYATGISAACSLAAGITGEGRPAVERYLKFLGGGSSDYPLELLKTAGVDLSTPKPVEDALKVFEYSIGELEQLI